ncbi:MarR family transcriptional regulator [Paracoccus aerodenitrificans]|uniref:MarR family transcriptional regulator n=1 Tax=Paracoccus aerodenitrificans TaxID=3017781 RepID=UPI0022F0D95E|nr:MarR family transcriptional regulator [Paracoccus aerodenitrificans]WBU63582.1 MarR family transcriptional regulator [Paracoccus aerodenitrificans]
MKDEKLLANPSTLDLVGMKYVDRSLAIACTRGREAIVSRFRELLRREDLSEQQWRVLRILFDIGPITSIEISAHACIHKVSISRILRSLESRGLVSRKASRSDARASIVELTSTGHKAMLPLVDEATEIHSGIARDFGVDRYEQLLQLLRELSEINNPVVP